MANTITTYDTIPNPYINPYLQRSNEVVSSTDTTLTDLGDSSNSSDGSSGSGSSSDSPNSNGSTQVQAVKSDGAIGDVWIRNFIRSQNWKPSTQGFAIDGQTGYAEFHNVKVIGNITAVTGNIGGFIIGATDLTSTFNGYTTKISSGPIAFSAGPTGAPTVTISQSGLLTAVAGTIGGWNITSTMLRSATSGVRIELNTTANRISIFDAVNEKVVMGYLNGLPKHDGSGNWGVGDYGFWVRTGDMLSIDGDGEYTSGDWLIQNDASYLVKDSSDNTIIRLGTDTGEKGLFIYNTSGVQLAKFISDAIYVGTSDSYLQYTVAGGLKLYSNATDAITIDYGSGVSFIEGGNIKFTSVVAPSACVATLIDTTGAPDGTIVSDALAPGTVVQESDGNTQWVDINNIKVEDGNFTTSTLVSQSSYDLILSNFGFSIPAGATITGIKLEIKGKNVNGYDLGVWETSAGSGMMITLTTTNEWNSFGGPTEDWGMTLPYLSADYINSSTFGFGVNVDFAQDPITETVSLDAARVTVYYTIDIDNGTHSYKITYVTSSGESELGSISNVVTVDDTHKEVDLSGIPLSMSGAVTERRIYRTKANLGVYWLLATIPDNITTTFVDIYPDGNLTGDYANNKENNTFGKIFIDGIPSLSLGARNTFLGQNTGDTTTNGWNNVAIGNSFLANTSGSKNTAIGSFSLNVNTIGSDNTAIGAYTLYSNISGLSNVAIGENALYSNISSSGNVAIGINALYHTTSGDRSVAIGTEVLLTNTIGYDNTGVGYNSLHDNTEGSWNTALGIWALFKNTTANYNTAIGYSALFEIKTGGFNVAIGGGAGEKLNDATTPNTDSDHSIFIGRDTSPLADGDTCETVIGALAKGHGSNTTTIGSSIYNTRTFINGITNIITKTPANAGSAGTTGDIAWDASYIYVCTATNTWKRAGIATW